MRSSSARVLVPLVLSSYSSGGGLVSVARVAQSGVRRVRWYSSSKEQTSHASDSGVPPASWLTMAGGAVGLGLLARNLLFSTQDQHVEEKKEDVVNLNALDADHHVDDDDDVHVHVDDDDNNDNNAAAAENTSEVQDHHDPQGVLLLEEHEEHDDDKNPQPVVVVDSHVVLSSVESVLTKTADSMLREDAETLSQEENVKTLSQEENVKNLPHASNSSTTQHELYHQTNNNTKKNEEYKEVQITASRLIHLANERRKDVHFEAFSARHKQAEADAETLQDILRVYKQQHAMQLEQLKSAEDALKATLSHLEHMQRELLEAQKTALSIQHEKDMTRERVKRQEVLDSARLQLDAVSDALSRQSRRAQKSQEAHKISTAVFHLREGLFSTHPSDEVKASLDYLLAVEDDPIVRMAAMSLQQCGMSIKKHTQLLSDFEHKVKRPVKELSYIPQGKGGMLTSLAAKVANALQVETQHDGIYAVSKDVEDGNLIEAADALLDMLQGTAAMHAARDWLCDVKRFATAHQALHVLDARAACINDIL